MKRLVLVFACCLAVLACRRDPPPAPAAQEDEEVDSPFIETPQRLENDNLMNVAFGATVIDRDNEASYENSSAHAIDGMSWTSWNAATNGKLSGVFALAAPTRVRRLGVSLPIVPGGVPARLRIETSLDGAAWAPAFDKSIEQNSGKLRLFDVDPVVARYLRVSLDTSAPASAIESLYVMGEETAPFVQRPLEGCWEINYEPARFVRNGARVTGTIGDMVVDGGTDGRIYRLMWRKQAMWGFAAVAISPDGHRLSGNRWHEEVGPKNNGDGWFGRRVPCAASEPIDTAKIAASLLDRSFWRMYGVRFDRQDRILVTESAEALDLAARLIRERPRHRFRVIAREFRETTLAKNRSRCLAKLDAMREVLRARGVDVARIEFVNAGTERNPVGVDSTAQRILDSGVDLQAVPPR